MHSNISWQKPTDPLWTNSRSQRTSTGAGTPNLCAIGDGERGIRRWSRASVDQCRFARARRLQDGCLARAVRLAAGTRNRIERAAIAGQTVALLFPDAEQDFRAARRVGAGLECVRALTAQAPLAIVGRAGEAGLLEGGVLRRRLARAGARTSDDCSPAHRRHPCSVGIRAPDAPNAGDARRCAASASERAPAFSRCASAAGVRGLAATRHASAA